MSVINKCNSWRPPFGALGTQQSTGTLRANSHTTTHTTTLLNRQPQVTHHIKPIATNQLIDIIFQVISKPKCPARCRLPSDKHAMLQPSNSCTGALAIHPKISLSQSSVRCSINPEPHLFNGCQDHFGRTPTELQRSIRLDLVRQLLC